MRFSSPTLYNDLEAANKRIKYLEDSITCFLTGEIGKGSTDPTQIALTKWGKKRLEHIKKTPKLLSSE